MILAKDIRAQFLSFFEQNGHSIVRSSSLIPKDDPTLLFTNAGMVQFKQVFLGQEKRPYSRATTSQKCLRVGGKHNDLENVGRTARHHTFFEMLGNFSFGDYFKEEAIVFAWTFLIKNLGLPKDRLYATVFRDDDEAMGLWKKVAGLPESRIFRLGEKDNFWSMGDTGPCGPCSEILVDQGEAMSCGPKCGIGQCDCDRFLEVWNLVFMQFNRDESGVMTPLPKPSIDTGMGLERITAVCQGEHSNFDGDLFRGLIGRMESLANVAYGRSAETDVALRVIADHSRSVAFLIADGILPSNEGRGYVLRRLIRRAFRFGRLIGLNDPFLHRICGEVVSQMGDSFPELTESSSFLDRVVSQEEERFSETLDKGLALLEGELKTLKGKGQKRISGEVAFKLYDTFGFPLDIVNDIAEKQGFTVDEPGFKDCMAGQKKQSKEAWSGSGEKDVAGQFSVLLKSGVTSRFIGYDFLEGQGTILALIDQSGEDADQLSKGQNGYLVVSDTPFYGESGGQSGDKGRLQTQSGQAEVSNTLKPSAKLTVHAVTITQGEVKINEQAQLIVDEGLRVATARNHTCTHLLHAALRRVLGTHVKQAGSFVTPTRLRFDFSHIAAMNLDELRAVEEDVNRAILAGLPVQTQVLSYDQAVAKGAMALFGEKYEDEVRMVEVPGVSSELCGGTHLADTGRAGSFCILSESGVAAGVRRIEGLTGWEALHYWRERRDAVQESLALVKGQARELPHKVAELQDQIKVLIKEKKGLEDKLVSGAGKDYLSGVENVGGVHLLCVQVDGADARALRTLMDDLRSKLASGIICLASGVDGKAALIISVSKDLHDRFTAPALIKDVAKLIGGSGGGRPDMAQAGGTDPGGIPQSFKVLKSLIA